MSLFSVIPAKVPRQARDPELVERAGIQFFWALAECLDPGFHRGDDFLRCRRLRSERFTIECKNHPPTGFLQPTPWCPASEFSSVS